MTLHETIAKRNRLEKEIEVLKQRINKWNVVARIKNPVSLGSTSGDNTISPRPFDITNEMVVLGQKIDILIQLNTNIHNAYSEIQDSIIKKQETEKYLMFLKDLNLKEDFYGQCDKAIDDLKQYALIENVEDELDELSLAISKFEFQKVV